MRFVKYILVIFVSALFVVSVSCDDDFDSDSESRITETNISSSPILAEQALMGVYAKMTKGSMYGKKLSYYCSLNSDIECISGSTDNGRRAIARGVATSYNTESIDIITNCYSTIRECNNLISATDKGINELKGEQLKKMLSIKAEVTVLRAFIYHDMVRVFGDIPYITNNYNTDNISYKVVENRKNILTQEIANVEDWIEYLDGEVDSFERLNKYSSYALLAEMCFTRSGRSMISDVDTDEDTDDKIEYLKKARYYLEKIVNSDKYELENSYEKIFKKLMSYDNVSSEILFALPMTRGNSGELGYFISTKHDEGSKYGSTECGVLAPVTYFYDFDCNDLRRDVTLTLHKYTKDSQQNLSGINNISFGKFRREWLQPVYEGKQKYTGVDLPIMRYSDVLLMLAECRLEVENDIDGAKDILRKVRVRAFKSSDVDMKVDHYLGKMTTYLTTLEGIRKERMFELGGERKRKFDLMRYGILDKSLSESKVRLNNLKERKAEFIEVPEKIYWRLSDDSEHIKYATVDENDFAADFDFDSDGLKNTKWSGAVASSFVERMCESEGNLKYFLPLPIAE